MPYTKPEQKWISFEDTPEELEKISEDMKNGWSIVSLLRNGNYYAGIMELTNTDSSNEEFFIPPRKKLKISS